MIEADIIVKGQSFGATQVEFKAVSQRGRDALAAAGGGFACVGITVKKSFAGDYLDNLRGSGCIVKWAD